MVAGGDTITDFVVANLDKIAIVYDGATDLSQVTGFVQGTASNGETLIAATTGGNNANFVTGVTPTAQSAQATFLYDTATGILSFDADGTTATVSAITIATLTGTPTLTATDITIA